MARIVQRRSRNFGMGAGSLARRGQIESRIFGNDRAEEEMDLLQG